MSALPLWRLSLTIPRRAVPLFEDVLAGHCQVLSQRLSDEVDVVIEALTGAPPDVDLSVDLALAAAAAGIAVPAVTIEPLAKRNWLAENREVFAAFRLGRFFIHQHEDDAVAPPAMVSIAVDAGLAFGSGRHASTAGCLAALDHLRPWIPSGPVLDLGCGSGILAIAATRTLRRPVVAADIDAVAVRITGENAARNGVAPWVRTVTAAGCAHPAIRARAPYALVFANILARPLQRLARPIVTSTQAGGLIILAGFIARDAAGVLAAYRALGCSLQRRIVIDGWTTLALRRRQSRGSSSTKLQGW